MNISKQRVIGFVLSGYFIWQIEVRGWRACVDYIVFSFFCDYCTEQKLSNIHTREKPHKSSTVLISSTAANQQSRATILFAIALTQWMTTAVVAGDKYLNEWVVNTPEIEKS